jgi:hypothetical protein
MQEEDLDETVSMDIIQSVKSDRLLLWNELVDEHADPMDFGVTDFYDNEFIEVLKTRLCSKGQAWEGMRLCTHTCKGRPVPSLNVLHTMKVAIAFQEEVFQVRIDNRLITTNDRLNWLYGSDNR